MPATLLPVTPQPGRPLYLSVRDAVRAAVDAGTFPPGEQLPSTKELSESMEVSLVTMHRALQELVASGVLSRSQGKGTFVHQRYKDPARPVATARVGLVFHAEASLADYYHGQVLEGIRQASEKLHVDLLLLRFSEVDGASGARGGDVRNECDGYLLLNPLPSTTDALVAERKNRPCYVVGARPRNPRIPSIDVDNIDVARQAVLHLSSLGHKRIGFVGGAGEESSNSFDRWSGFNAVMKERKLQLAEGSLLKSESWRLSERERMSLIRLLSSPSRPTALFAAGYYFALDVYAAASTVGLRIPADLSLVAVDDPPSAAHLSPPLTTLRQPLVQLGHAAVTALVDEIRQSPSNLPNAAGGSGARTLFPELIIRRSTTAPSV